MGEKIEIVCDHCDRSFEIDNDVESGFCLHCGTAFKRSVKPTGDIVFTADRIKEIYSGYIREMGELSVKKPRNIFETLIGRDSYGADEIHKKNRELLINAIHDLSEEMKSKPDGNECTGTVCLFLKQKDARATAVYWPLVACEQLVEPLLEWVPLDMLTEIYVDYCLINPSNQSLPNQIQLKKSMAKAIADRGGEVPRRGLFSKSRNWTNHLSADSD